MADRFRGFLPVVVDVETGGFNCKTDALLEIAAVLIEVDGDFHHCNPNSKHRIPIYPIQLKTIGNDIRKNILAKDKGFKLLRFWETDINNNPEYIVKLLKKELGI